MARCGAPLASLFRWGSSEFMRARARSRFESSARDSRRASACLLCVLPSAHSSKPRQRARGPSPNWACFTQPASTAREGPLGSSNNNCWEIGPDADDFSLLTLLVRHLNPLCLWTNTEERTLSPGEAGAIPSPRPSWCWARAWTCIRREWRPEAASWLFPLASETWTRTPCERDCLQWGYSRRELPRHPAWRLLGFCSAWGGFQRGRSAAPVEGALRHSVEVKPLGRESGRGHEGGGDEALVMLLPFTDDEVDTPIVSPSAAVREGIATSRSRVKSMYAIQSSGGLYGRAIHCFLGPAAPWAVENVSGLCIRNPSLWCNPMQCQGELCWDRQFRKPHRRNASGLLPAGRGICRSKHPPCFVECFLSRLVLSCSSGSPPVGSAIATTDTLWDHRSSSPRTLSTALSASSSSTILLSRFVHMGHHVCLVIGVT